MKSTLSKKEIISKKETNLQTKFAVILHENQQYQVREGMNLYVPLIKQAKEKEKIIFDKVLLTNDAVGTPYLKNHKVLGQVIKPLHKDKKIIVFKYKSKKNYRVKSGHRAKLTMIKIDKIMNK